MSGWVHRVAVVIDASGSIDESAALLDGLLAQSPALALMSPRRHEYRGRSSLDDVLVWAAGPTEQGGFPIWHQWMPVFRGRFSAYDGSKVRLEGRIGVHAFVPAFTILVVVVLGGWLSAGVPYLVGRLQEGSAVGAGTWFGNLIMPIVFAGAFALFSWYGSRLYDRECDELETFLREAVT
jgi:hypothetical protein